MAHSQKQDYNRSHYTKSTGDTLKREYEDFFAEEPEKEVVAAAPSGNQPEAAQQQIDTGQKEEEKKDANFVSLDDV